jgi:hypothetical protein
VRLLLSMHPCVVQHTCGVVGRPITVHGRDLIQFVDEGDALADRWRPRQRLYVSGATNTDSDNDNADQSFQNVSALYRRFAYRARYVASESCVSPALRRRAKPPYLPAIR